MGKKADGLMGKGKREMWDQTIPDENHLPLSAVCAYSSRKKDPSYRAQAECVGSWGPGQPALDTAGPRS